jgi:RHS repeat-associated protein
MANTLYTNIGGMLVAENDGGTERSYVTDVLGSTQAMADSSQTITDTFDYWPYGEPQASTGSNDTPFKFVGARGIYTDADDLHYIQRRHYMPGLGRWPQRDVLADDWTRYSYCRDNPVNLYDDNGLFVLAAPPATMVVLGSPAGIVLVGLGLGQELGEGLDNWTDGGWSDFWYEGVKILPQTHGLGLMLPPRIDELPPVSDEEWCEAMARLGRPCTPKPAWLGGGVRTMPPMIEPWGGPDPNGLPEPMPLPGYRACRREWVPCEFLCDDFCKEQAIDVWDSLECVDGCVAACIGGAPGFTWGNTSIIFHGVGWEIEEV